MPGAPSGLGPRGEAGGFGVSRAGCYPLDVRVVGGRTYRVRLSLGRPCR